MKINPVNKTNFTATSLAKVGVKGLNSQYKLFNIHRSDKKFLRNWYAQLELDKLMPNLNVEDYIIWDGVIESAVETSSDKGRKTILETCNDKICGILTYFKDIDRYKIAFASTVPVEKNKRTPFAGQILFNTFFKLFLKDFYYTVELDAIKYTPFDSVRFYNQLGFNTFAENNYVKNMSIHRPSIIECVNEQDEFISSVFAESRKRVDLYECIDFQQV